MLRLAMVVAAGYFALPYVSGAIPESIKQGLKADLVEIFPSVSGFLSDPTLADDTNAEDWKNLFPEGFREQATASAKQLTDGGSNIHESIDTRSEWFPDLRFEEITQTNVVGFKCQGVNSFTMSKESCE